MHQESNTTSQTPTIKFLHYTHVNELVIAMSNMKQHCAKPLAHSHAIKAGIEVSCILCTAQECDLT